MNHHSSTPITARLVLSSLLPFSFSFLFSVLDLDTPLHYTWSQFRSSSPSFPFGIVLIVGGFSARTMRWQPPFRFCLLVGRCIANKFESFQFYIKFKRLFSALSSRGPSFSIFGLWAKINKSNSNILI